MNYLQKKKQAIIMMLAAQIIKTAQGYPVTINDSQSGAAVDYTVWGNTETRKNLFDIQGWYNWLRTFSTEYVSKTEVDGISCIYYRPNATYNKQYMKGKFKEKSRYTISFRAKGIVGTGASTGFRFVYTDGTDNRVYVQNKDEWNSYKLVSNANKTIDHIEMLYNVAQGCYFDENSIQLELGETATEYEPYTESYVGDKTAADEPQGYKIPIVNSGKNLIPYPYYNTTKTQNGVTFTDNGDGSITVNGTATVDNGYFVFSRTMKNDIDVTKKYVLSGGYDLSVYIALYQDGAWKKEFHSRNGNSIILDFPNYTDIEYNKILCNTYVPRGKTVNNIIVKPQLELGEVATEYEPYRAPSTANIYLDEPLKQGESVNFGLDNLPELQLFEGSNTITANTAVKPEKISVDYYEKG